MQARKTRDIPTAVLGGLAVCGVLASLLSIGVDTLISTAIGGAIGGITAAYLLYGKVGQAAIAGALSGLLGFPFFLGVSEILIVFGVIAIPPGPTPDPSELQAPLVILTLVSMGAGIIAGSLTGAARHPSAEPAQVSATTPSTPSTASQVRYCVQCGAQIPAGVTICPHCNARQP